MEWHRVPLGGQLAVPAAAQAAKPAAEAGLGRLPILASLKATVVLLLAGVGLAAWALQLRRAAPPTAKGAAAAEHATVV